VTEPKLTVAGSSGGLALVEGLADERFDDRLAADVELFGGDFQFFEHGGREIDVDALDGLHHFPGVGKKVGHVLAVICHAGDGLDGQGLSSRTRFLHRASVLPESLSIESRDDTAPFGVLADFKDHGIQVTANPADGAMLSREIGTLIEVIRMKENLLCFLEADSAPRIPAKTPALPLIESGIAWGITVIP